MTDNLLDIAQDLTKPGVVTHGAEGQLARGVLKFVEIGDAMAARLASLAQTLRERNYDDAPQIERLVEEWQRTRGASNQDTRGEE